MYSKLVYMDEKACKWRWKRLMYGRNAVRRTELSFQVPLSRSRSHLLFARGQYPDVSMSPLRWANANDQDPRHYCTAFHLHSLAWGPRQSTTESDFILSEKLSWTYGFQWRFPIIITITPISSELKANINIYWEGVKAEMYIFLSLSSLCNIWERNEGIFCFSFDGVNELEFGVNL